MTWLSLTPNFKIKVGVSFEHADDESIVLTSDPEVQVQAVVASGMRAHEATPDAIDAAMGLKCQAMATLTVLAKHSIAESRPLFLTKDELRRHIYECTAVLKAMDTFVDSVDEHMLEYRTGLRKSVQKKEAVD